MAQEQSVQLQTDALTPTGAPLRIIVSGANVTIAGAPVATGQQVVSIADSTGAIIDQTRDVTATLTDLLAELREIRKLVSMFMGVPYAAADYPQTSINASGL